MNINSLEQCADTQKVVLIKQKYFTSSSQLMQNYFIHSAYVSSMHESGVFTS